MSAVAGPMLTPERPTPDAMSHACQGPAPPHENLRLEYVSRQRLQPCRGPPEWFENSSRAGPARAGAAFTAGRHQWIRSGWRKQQCAQSIFWPESTARMSPASPSRSNAGPIDATTSAGYRSSRLWADSALQANGAAAPGCSKSPGSNWRTISVRYTLEALAVLAVSARTGLWAAVYSTMHAGGGRARRYPRTGVHEGQGPVADYGGCSLRLWPKY
jgi:hypothetical protein